MVQCIAQQSQKRETYQQIGFAVSQNLFDLRHKQSLQRNTESSFMIYRNELHSNRSQDFVEFRFQENLLDEAQGNL